MFGAEMLGEITIGQTVIIGANAVVIWSVLPRCIAVSARISREIVNVRDYTGWSKTPGGDNLQ